MSARSHVSDHPVQPVPAGGSRKWRRWLLIVLFAVAFGLVGGMTAHRTSITSAQKSGAPTKIEPATIEKVEGTELNRVILSEKAAQRLDIQTAPVREDQVGGTPRKLIPYAAVIYDLEGKAWAYTSPKPLTFVRQLITVDDVQGDTAVLVDGPPAGTRVATVGVAELYGADTGVGK